MNLLRGTKIAVALGLVFAAGVISGSVATRHFIEHGFKRSMNFEHWKAGVMRVLQTKLDLSPDQHQKIAALLDQHRNQIHGTFARTFNDCGHILVELQHEIDQELTPQQRQIHEKMKQQFRADLKRKFNFSLPEDPGGEPQNSDQPAVSTGKR